MATAQYERSGTRASAHPDPDLDPELRIKSPNSVPDPSVPDHRMHYLKSDVEMGVRSIPVPYLFHTRSRPNKVFSTYSPCIIVGTSKRQSSFHTLRIKSAIQTLRIRQHRNVHSGHVVLISSHMAQSPKDLSQLAGEAVMGSGVNKAGMPYTQRVSGSHKQIHVMIRIQCRQVVVHTHVGFRYTL